MSTPYPKTGMNLDDPHSLSKLKLVFLLADVTFIPDYPVFPSGT